MKERFKERGWPEVPSSGLSLLSSELGPFFHRYVGQWGETKAATLKATTQAAANDQSVILISLGMSVNAES
jgi:hypothetical protein